MPVKTTVRFRFLLIRLTSVEGADSVQGWWACGPPELDAVLVGQKLENFENNLESSSKAEDRYTHPVTRNPTSRYIP